MPKFRKKPVIIDAVQFENNYESVIQMYKFINGEESIILKTDLDHLKFQDYAECIIKNGYGFKTLESDGETQKAIIGDWIIKGIHGEFYPCKPDIFEKTYEKVEG